MLEEILAIFIQLFVGVHKLSSAQRIWKVFKLLVGVYLVRIGVHYLLTLKDYFHFAAEFGELDCIWNEV
jgi:hypothetical protein